jgi:hypothetical protein
MSYLLCLDDCGKEPDLTSPFPDSAINWLCESTPDQKRIEDWLEGATNSESSIPAILHVGVGNSQLAKRFWRRQGVIDGITLGARENDFAFKSHWYGMVYMVNKYSSLLSTMFDRQYDFIIDNNLASYACCVTHFHQMIDNYRAALAPGGAILTDRAGLAHMPGDPNWNLVDDIQAMADRFGLVLTRETEMVYALRK